MGTYEQQRKFLKSNFNDFKNIKTDKMKGMPQPEENKYYPSNAMLIKLPAVKADILKKRDIYECIKDRRSTRLYSEESISLDELSFLLWATQGITGKNKSGGITFRTVPCSGATHSFETYLFIMNVTGLEKGLYRYLPAEHKLLLLLVLEDVDNRLDAITLDQPFVPHFAKKACVTFAWSTTPYRSEWKYDITAHKKILIDIGHVCQNLYLAGEALAMGVCAIGIYDQEAVDYLFQLDGENEFVIYLAAVGRQKSM
ncbi:SagB/ThcOx family dehydrogenase [Anaerocolumna sp. AGMB13020]|uniref:SagB/ThcOx family dehydrogenase n=1 Tax=Anaerocolumna sp. AGMB13020 TaxID=3081750 RepID=UPI0029547514|nr:SagB/ThcOx family dehydrogenase [Anaerocolumna sp. AGMB13020]WOO35828.1 SagB/ThcOx family dehydrogenase [Anaerocolumna sp. AGMB13020]